MAARFSGQTPAPVPEESPSALEEEKAWDMTPLEEIWFDNAIFFGDSVSGTLQATALQIGSLVALFISPESEELTAVFSDAAG